MPLYPRSSWVLRYESRFSDPILSKRRDDRPSAGPTSSAICGAPLVGPLLKSPPPIRTLPMQPILLNRTAVGLSRLSQGECRSIRPHAAPLQETFEVGGFRTAWMPGTSPGRTREAFGRPHLCNRSCSTGQPWAWPGYPKANAGAFVRPPPRCKKLWESAGSARRGCPGQARAGRVRLLGDLTYATDPAQPDSRGPVPAIPRRKRSIRPPAAPLQETFEVGGFRTAWMPGTSPGRTREAFGRPHLCNRSCSIGQSWACPGHPKGSVRIGGGDFKRGPTSGAPH